jgi:branched-chain amino acid transport system substrate-binding protein
MSMKSLHLRAAALPALVVVAVAVAACGSSSSSSSSSSAGSSSASSTSSSAAPASSSSSKLPATINVTAVQDLSGPVAYVGKNVVQGLQLAANQINSSGLLHGSKIVLSVKDTGSTVSTATSQFSQAVGSNATAIFGPLLSQEALATAPLAQRASVVDIAIESQVNGLLETGPYIYRATSSQLRFDNLIAEEVAPKIASNKTVRILTLSDTPTLVQAAAQLTKKFESLGVKVLGTVGVPITTTDFSSLATKLSAGNPGAIGLLLIGTANPAAVTAVRTGGYKGVLFGNEAATNGSLKPAGAAADGFIYAVDYNPGLTFPSAVTFTKLFQSKYPSQVPNGYNATGYDAMNEFAHAIALSGDASRAGVQKGMQMLMKTGGLNGAIGPEKFTGTGNRDLSVAGTLVVWTGSAEKILKVGNPNLTFQP